MKRKLIYVILLNYNGFSDTVECIESLDKAKNGTQYKLNICVVDNSSSNLDEYSKLCGLQEKYTNMTIIFNTENNGYAAGNNIGIDFAIKNNADYIWVLNNDVTINENVIDELLKAAEKCKAFFSTKIYNYYDKNELMYSGAVINKRNLRLKFLTNEIAEDSLTEFLSGASIFASADMWAEYKLPEGYFLYEEDVDFSLMLKKCKIPMYIVSKAFIFHKESVSTNKLHSIKEYYLRRNKLILAKKYAEDPWKSIFFIEKFICFPFRILRRFIKGIFYNKEYVYYTKYECKAYWDFINGRSGRIDGNK